MDLDSDNKYSKSVGIAFIWNDHILLTKHPAEGNSFENTLGIPKGRQEPNEEGADFLTAQREIKEEIGIDVPLEWLVHSPIHHVVLEDGWKVDYYIVHVDDLSHIGMDNTLVHPNQYQVEEVDYACFIPLSDAHKYMNVDQQPILAQLGVDTYDDGGMVEKNFWVVRAQDVDGTIHTFIFKDDLSENPNEKIYQHFINMGIKIQDTDIRKIEFREGQSSIREAFYNFFENETGEVVDEGETFMQYNTETKEVTVAEMQSLSGMTYTYDPMEMTFTINTGDIENDYDIKREGGSVDEDFSYEILRYGEEGKKLNKSQKVNLIVKLLELAIPLGYDIPSLNIIGKPLSHFNYDAIRELIADMELELHKQQGYEPDGFFYKGELDEDEFEEGGVIEGQLHSECNEPHGCGEKFEVGEGGKIIEAERDEAVIVSSAFDGNLLCPDDNCEYVIEGTPSQIASAINVMGGGKQFDKGAKVFDESGNKIDKVSSKAESKDTDVEKTIESGTIIINRRSMADNQVYKAKGTPRQIASVINSINDNGVVIENGGTIEKA